MDKHGQKRRDIPPIYVALLQIIAFFIKRVFMNPNGVLNSQHAYIPPPHEQRTPKFLPFVEIPEDALSILRKIGDTVRLIIMNDVQSKLTCVYILLSRILGRLILHAHMSTTNARAS